MLSDNQLEILAREYARVDMPQTKEELESLLLFFAKDIERETRHAIQRQLQAAHNALSERIDFRRLIEKAQGF